MWDPIVSVPDYCLSFYFSYNLFVRSFAHLFVCLFIYFFSISYAINQTN